MPEIREEIRWCTMSHDNKTDIPYIKIKYNFWLNFMNKVTQNIPLSIYADNGESQGEVEGVFTGRLQNAENGCV